jgi:hypothetical protein
MIGALFTIALVIALIVFHGFAAAPGLRGLSVTVDVCVWAFAIVLSALMRTSE